MLTPYELFPMKVYEDGSMHPFSAPVVYEQEVELILNGEHVKTVACSPGAYKELGIGLLLSEGLLNRESEIQSIDCSNDGKILVLSSPTGSENNNARVQSPQLLNKYRISPESGIQFKPQTLLDLIFELDNRAQTFKITGGVHSAALADASGLLVRYEDIGRHNAVDKVLGYAFLNKILMLDKCLVFSGRISTEILQKVVVNGIPFVLSRSAPTLQAIRLAEELGITLVGFARGSCFSVYTHWQRIAE